MKPDVLLTKPMIPAVASALERDYTLHRLWEAEEPKAFLASVGPLVRGVVTDGGFGLDADLMRALPRLEIVAVFGVGTDAVDLAQAAERGIAVTTTPDVLTEDVADLALGLLLAAARQIVRGDSHVRSGAWSSGSSFPLTRRVNGKRAGILGLGRIGRAVAHRLSALNIQVAYCNRRPSDVPYTYYSEVSQLARNVDFLIITASGGPTSRHVVSREVLEALGPDGVLVNVARGSVVDEHALVDLLAHGKLAAAALDVFENEPFVSPALRTLPNVVLQPHHASGTQEGRAAMGDLVIRNLEAHFAGRLLPTPVSLPVVR